MKMKTLVNDLDAAGHYRKDLEITGIAYDSRKVGPGDLFVAIKGYKSDGHDYIEQAKAAGATAIVVERDGYRHTNHLRVDSSRRALALLSRNFYGDPSRELNLIGVTGTNGKTSITYIVRDLLKAMGRTYGVIGTIGNRIGETVFPTSVTTPESLELNQLFRQMVDVSTETAVMEVSSHSLSLDRVYGLDFDVAVFTNLTQDHLDYHKSMSGYFKAKKILFDMARKSVINIDDPYGQKLYNRKKEAISYGLTPAADLHAARIETSQDGTGFDLVWNHHVKRVHTPYHGEIYVRNVLAGVGALLAVGYEPKDVFEALEAVQPVPGRLEQVVNDQGFHVFVDYAHTPDALDNVLSIVRSFTVNRVICVFGCGGDRDRKKRPKMGRISESKADFTIVTSDNPRSENPEAIIDEILEGMSSGSNKYTVQPDREKAIGKAIAMAHAGDTILIAGKGHETYQIIGEAVIDFDDREKARKALEEKGHDNRSS